MKSKRGVTILLLFVLIVGLSLVLYPSLSNYWNSFTQSKAIAKYTADLDNLSEEDTLKMLNEAIEFNKAILKRDSMFSLTVEERKQYHSLLNVSGTGIMGYIDIPSINCSLPLYHGTEDSVLQIAAGHIEWSSLPVGGDSTHCIISGHRGLPSAKLMTDLDKVRIGDTFVMYILNETLTYEVDRIRIVTPQETSDLLIESGKDYCTLLTCTPYGINSHRMLVRGHRIENTKESSMRIVADAMEVKSVIIAPVFALPILTALLIWLIVKGRKKKKEFERYM